MSKGLVGIIGGAGVMGSYWAELFPKEKYDVLISDINVEKGMKLAEEKGYGFLTPDELEGSDIDFDVMLFSILPIADTYPAIERFAPKVRKGGLLTDVTSVKINPVKYMLENSYESVSVIGMHPMFRPDLSLEGQRVILTPARDHSGWQSELEKIINDKKGIVKITTPEEHDYMMSIVQGLTHSTSIISLRTLKQLGVNLEKAMEFSNPVYRMLFELMARVVSGQASLYADIQFENPGMPEVFEEFYNSFTGHRGLVTDKNKADFEKWYNMLKEFVAVYSAKAQAVAQIEGKPKGVELYFQSPYEKLIREEARLNEPVKTYKKDISKMIVDTGSLSRVSKKFPEARYTEQRDRTRKEGTGTVAFFVRNYRHPQEPDKMIRFTPRVSAPGKKDNQPDYVRVQLINYHLDPILNFFDTVEKNEDFKGLPPFVVSKIN